MYPTPAVAKASRDILLLLKKGIRTSNYLHKKIGYDYWSAIGFLALQDLIEVDIASYKNALNRLQALGTLESIGKLTHEHSTESKKIFDSAKYFLSKRGKVFVKLLLEKEV